MNSPTKTNSSASASTIALHTWREKGLLGFYPGGSAIAARQASNWASRVGFTEGARGLVATVVHGKGHHRLSVREEAAAGIIGGVLSCWLEETRPSGASRAPSPLLQRYAHQSYHEDLYQAA